LETLDTTFWINFLLRTLPIFAAIIGLLISTGKHLGKIEETLRHLDYMNGRQETRLDNIERDIKSIQFNCARRVKSED
jgi:hypothetical protein